MLFRKFSSFITVRIGKQKPIILPPKENQDSCACDFIKKSGAYPALLKIRKSADFTALPGSLTLEAAFITPLVIMLVTALLSLFTMMVTELQLQHALEAVGGELAGSSYAAVSLTSGEKNALLRETGENIVLTIASEQLVKRKIREELGEAFEKNTLIQGGLNGISFLGTGFDPESQNITICANYSLQVPFFSQFGAKVSISQKAVRRAWTGRGSSGNPQTQIVYVAENGVVYHTSLSCTHIKLSITEVKATQVDRMRNASGGKYYACELCGEEDGSSLYITNYGDRYHTNRNCSGLKRTIRSIPITQAGDLPLCTKCRRREGS